MTFTITCPCDCGEHVTAHDSGFSATTVEVEACTTAEYASVTVRKGTAYGLAVPATGLRHQDGLVVFG